MRLSLALQCIIHPSGLYEFDLQIEQSDAQPRMERGERFQTTMASFEIRQKGPAVTDSQNGDQYHESTVEWYRHEARAGSAPLSLASVD